MQRDRPTQIQGRANAGPILLVSILFVISGATGLAYETIWFKRFGQVWGSSALSLASVVACFLFGLGLGARLFGGLADRMPRPLLIYAGCELGIGLLALAVPWELSGLMGLMAKLYPTLENQPLPLALTRILLTLLVLLPPSILMGGTFPLLVRLFTLSGRSIGRAASWLYALNSLGAALGVWLTGFYLLPKLGILSSNALVAATNIAIAALAWAVALRLQALPQVDPSKERKAATGRTRSVCIAAALAGGGSLILQMVWARELTVLLGGSTYAYTALLTVFVAGIGAGSLVFHRLAPRDDQLVLWVPLGITALVIATAGGLLLSPTLAVWVGEHGPARANPAFNALLCSAVSSVLQFIPTLLMGFLFPAFVQLARQGPEFASRTVGRIYAWNTLGSILCAFATAPVLLPLLGSKGAVGLALLSYLTAMLVLFVGRILPFRRQAWAVGTLAAVVYLSWLLAWHPDPRSTNLGLFMYGSSRYPNPTEDVEILFFAEGATTNILVVDEPEPQGANISLRVNGKIDGGTGDMRTQLGLSWLPHFIRPNARDVLVIGFGTGTTAGASLQFPTTEVDCVEIEPAVFAASHFFHDINFRPEESPRFRAIGGDARSHVSGTDRQYDLIISEPSNPWIAGISNLYTIEFYRSAKNRLRSEGMLAQWIETYSLSQQELLLILRTVRTVFPHTMLLQLSSGDLQLLASASPLDPTKEVLVEAQAMIDENPSVRKGLDHDFGMTDVRPLFLAHILLDEPGLTEWVAADTGTGLNTDYNLRLEFDAPRHIWHRPESLSPEIQLPTARRLLLKWSQP